MRMDFRRHDGNVSIHAPAGGDTYPGAALVAECLFRSTPPQGATLKMLVDYDLYQFNGSFD